MTMSIKLSFLGAAFEFFFFLFFKKTKQKNVAFPLLARSPHLPTGFLLHLLVLPHFFSMLVLPDTDTNSLASVHRLAWPIRQLSWIIWTENVLTCFYGARNIHERSFWYINLCDWHGIHCSCKTDLCCVHIWAGKCKDLSLTSVTSRSSKTKDAPMAQPKCLFLVGKSCFKSRQTSRKTKPNGPKAPLSSSYSQPKAGIYHFTTRL